MAGISQKTTNQFMALGVVVLALAAFGIWTGWKPLDIGGQGAAPPEVTGTGICPTGTGTTDVNHKTLYLDTSTNQEAQSTTTVALYLKGATTTTQTGTTTTGNYTHVGTVNCGALMTGFYGDGGANYYYAVADITDTNKAQVYVDARPKKANASTYSLSNESSIGQSSIGANAIGAGGTDSSVSLKVKAGPYYFGDGAFEVCALFPTNNFTKVSFGAGAIEIGADSSMSVSTGQAIKCYEVSQQLFNYNSVELPVVIQAASGVTPSNVNISLWINDKSGYIKDGQLKVGYFNADTLADLGLARVGLATAIRVV